MMCRVDDCISAHGGVQVQPKEAQNSSHHLLMGGGPFIPPLTTLPWPSKWRRRRREEELEVGEAPASRGALVLEQPGRGAAVQAAGDDTTSSKL
jgi:hypothetical protein